MVESTKGMEHTDAQAVFIIETVDEGFPVARPSRWEGVLLGSLITVALGLIAGGLWI